VTDAQFLVLVQRQDRQIELLEQIAIVLAAIMTGTEVVESNECQHPDESRISLATPAQPQHWICNDCKYEHGVIPN
jgi:hypothetical protein